MAILRSLVLWVTTACNLRCRYCYARGGEDPQDMSWRVAKRAIDLVAQSGEAFKIQLSGGEPLLHMELIKSIIEYCYALPTRFQIQTNATLVTPKLALCLRDLRVAVGVSLDGIPDVNDQLRTFPDGAGSAAAAIEGIRALAEVGVKVGMTCVLTRSNVAKLPQLVTLASYLGNVHGISLDVLRPVGRAIDEEVAQARPQDAARAVRLALEQAETLAAMGGTPVKIRGVEKVRYWLENDRNGDGYCHFDRCQALMVKPSGEAYPCASLAGVPSLRLGNVMASDFARRLGERLQYARKLVPLSSKCARCPDLRLCRGGCPARHMSTRAAPAEIAEVECRVRRVYLDHAREEL